MARSDRGDHGERGAVEPVAMRVFRPRSMTALLRAYGRNPDAMVFAGGTDIVPRAYRGSGRSLALPRRVLYLGNVQELVRVSRAPRHLDIGAGMSLSRLLTIGRHVLPRVLHEALSLVGNPTVRNLATLGGNICSACGGDSRAALLALDAQVEVRSVSGSRWLAIDELIPSSPAAPGPGRAETGAGEPQGERQAVAYRPVLQPGELLTRVRVPLEERDFERFRKVGAASALSPGALTFAGTARVAKGTLESLHLALAGSEFPLWRSRELESRLEGGRFPTSPKQVGSVAAELRRQLEQHPGISVYHLETAVRLVRWFLDSLFVRSMEL